jgi:hypothetical protein
LGKPLSSQAGAGRWLSVWMVQLIGLFGYVFRKPLLTVAIWRALVPVFVVTFVAGVIVSTYRISLLENISIASHTYPLSSGTIACNMSTNKELGHDAAYPTYFPPVGDGIFA